MQYGLTLPNFGAFGSPQIMAQLAQDAENAGWDGFFVWDHINRTTVLDVVDPWIVLAAVAMATETIKLGSMVTPLARRRPQMVARQTVSLDMLSNGRFILGVGLGGFSGAEVEWVNFGDEMDMKIRAAMTDEALEILDGLWSGEPFSFQGEHYTVGESVFLPRPVQQSRIPIWIAGYYPFKNPMRRAATWDGLFMLYEKADDEIVALRETVDYIHEIREDDSPFDVIYHPSGAIKSLTERRNIAEQAAKAGANWYFENVSPTRYGIAWDEDWQFDRMREMILEGAPRYE